jgi:hypothetical protein
MNTKLVFLLTKLLSSTNIAIFVFLISMMQQQHGFSSVEEEEETENNNNNKNPPGFKSIKKFDSNGKFIISWGSEGTGNGQFLHAHSIDIDSSDNVYIADSGNVHAIKKEGCSLSF